MTAAEYGSMENQAMAALQQLREKGVSRDDIGILMSREVYDMAKAGVTRHMRSVSKISGQSIGDTTSTSSPKILRRYSVQSLQGSQTTSAYSNSMRGRSLSQSQTMGRFAFIRNQHRNTHFSAKLSSPYAKHIKWRELPSQTGFVPDRSGNGGNGGRGCICLCTNGLTGCRIPHFSLIFSPVSQPGANLSGSLTR